MRSIPRKPPNITSGLCELWQLFSVRLPPPGRAHLPELPIARFALLRPGRTVGLIGKKSNFGEQPPRSLPDPIQTAPRSEPAQRARTRTQTRTHVPRSQPELSRGTVWLVTVLSLPSPLLFLRKKNLLNFRSDGFQLETRSPSRALASPGVTVYFREPEPVIVLSVTFTNITLTKQTHKIDGCTGPICKDSAHKAQR